MILECSVITKVRTQIWAYVDVEHTVYTVNDGTFYLVKQRVIDVDDDERDVHVTTNWFTIPRDRLADYVK